MPKKRPIRVGDTVTFLRDRVASSPQSLKLLPKVKGCRVVKIGKTDDGRPSALIEAFGQQIGVLVSDLRYED